MSLTGEQLAALEDIRAVWPDRRVVLIGASALGFYYDMRWRQTADVDLAVAVDFEDFPGALLERPGWQQRSRGEHGFTFASGVRVDVLPVGPRTLAAGTIPWASGHEMSVVCMDLAFAHAVDHRMPNGTSVAVPTPAVICLLKMVAFCDRPYERERDLEDIAQLMEEYVDATDHRRWDDAVDIEYELAPAFLLGLDVGRVVSTDAHRRAVERFLERVENLDSTDHAVMRRRGPASWAADDALAKRLAAFRRGLGPVDVERGLHP